MTDNEKTQASKLVRALLAAGCTLVIWNGGDDPELENARDHAEIMETLGASGHDEIIAYREGQRMGFFMLIWGNAEDGSELIADYTANEFCNGIVGTVEAI